MKNIPTLLRCKCYWYDDPEKIISFLKLKFQDDNYKIGICQVNNGKGGTMDYVEIRIYKPGVTYRLCDYIQP